jgi:hypothetical protein
MPTGRVAPAAQRRVNATVTPTATRMRRNKGQAETATVTDAVDLAFVKAVSPHPVVGGAGKAGTPAR